MIALRDFITLLIQGLDYFLLPDSSFGLSSGARNLPRVMFSLIILFIILRVIFHGIDR